MRYVRTFVTSRGTPSRVSQLGFPQSRLVHHFQNSGAVFTDDTPKAQSSYHLFHRMSQRHQLPPLLGWLLLRSHSRSLNHPCQCPRRPLRSAEKHLEGRVVQAFAFFLGRLSAEHRTHDTIADTSLEGTSLRVPIVAVFARVGVLHYAQAPQTHLRIRPSPLHHLQLLWSASVFRFSGRYGARGPRRPQQQLLVALPGTCQPNCDVEGIRPLDGARKYCSLTIESAR
jgi:hypothetical protein